MTIYETLDNLLVHFVRTKRIIISSDPADDRFDFVLYENDKKLFSELIGREVTERDFTKEYDGTIWRAYFVMKPKFRKELIEAIIKKCKEEKSDDSQ